jgi:hypothetical protein
MKTIFFALPLGVAMLVCSCDKSKLASVGDASFARKTFEGLAKGDQAVSEDIDWKTLRALGQDVGVIYVTMESEEDQRRFREGFITQFASSFQTAGGKVEDFVDWKVTEHDATHTVVTASSSNRILKIGVNERDGKNRVASLDVAIR